MMESHIGTKLIKAKPMNRQEYSDYRGLKLPSGEEGTDEGYLVEYQNSPNSNHPNHDGYISWSPKDVFEDSYKQSGNLTFGDAVEYLKLGHRVARSGWNGKSMFLFLVPGSTFKVNRPPLLGIYEEGTEIKYHAHIDMKTATGEIVPWLASQTDVLSQDWCLID
jgi:hypothetical protein